MTAPSDISDGSDYRIRIQNSYNFGEPTSYSNYFTIYTLDSITVTSPSSSSMWKKGNSYVIRWSYTGDPEGTGDVVVLHLYKGNTQIKYIITINLPVQDADYRWTVPSDLSDGSDYRIRIKSIYGSFTSYSNYFTIYIESLTVTSPSISSEWQNGTSRTITWSSVGSISNVKIDLYQDISFSETITTSTSNDGSYSWSIPTDLVDASNYRIKISDTSSPSIYDYSSYFTIYGLPSISISTPSSSSSWKIYKSYTINWNSIGTSSYVDIKLYKDDAYVENIVTLTGDDGSYTWSIPIHLDVGTTYQVYICDNSNPSTYDLSDYFELLETDTFIITSPISSSSWKMNTENSITWTSTGSVSYVDLQLFRNNLYVENIQTHTLNNGLYPWLISSTLSVATTYQIKIIDNSDSTTYNYSEYFEILEADTISITSPTSASSWEKGTLHDITWSSTGNIDFVDIKLYLDNSYMQDIIIHTVNDGTYSWSIPISLTQSGDYQIKIFVNSDLSIWEISDYFTIKNPIDPSPNGDDGDNGDDDDDDDDDGDGGDDATTIPSYPLFGLLAFFSIAILFLTIKLLRKSRSVKNNNK